MNFQSTWPHGRGIQRLNINLLKPARFNPNIMSVKSGEAIPGWIHYEPRMKNPLLKYLPHFLATFLVENMFDRLNLPEPVPLARQRSVRVYKDHRDRSWPMATLNTILQTVLVAEPDGTQIAVIGSVEWESEMFVGTTRLHVRTLDYFHGRIRRVVSVS